MVLRPGIVWLYLSAAKYFQRLRGAPRLLCLSCSSISSSSPFGTHTTPASTSSTTMTTRIHPHSPLPAPAMRAGTPSVQSKSHVLAGVQDAYWSDDEAVSNLQTICQRAVQ